MGVKILAYDPANYREPENYDIVVYSDISGEEINEDDVWSTDDGLCSREEMIDLFYNDFVKYKVEDEKEYEEAKKCLIEDIEADPDTFNNHPTIFKLNDDFNHNPCIYILEEDLHSDFLEAYLPRDWEQVDPYQLDPVDEYDPRDEYDPDDMREY